MEERRIILNSASAEAEIELCLATSKSNNNGRKLQNSVMSRYYIERTNTQDSLAYASNRNNLECVASFVVINQ